MFKKLILFVSSLFDPLISEGIVIDGRYTVIKHLGTGSYGRSYLVFDHESNQKLVLKALRLHKRITSPGRSGFFKEMELLKRIDHPGFPKFNKAGFYKGIPFYTMEHIDGKNFEQLIFHEDKQYSEKDAFAVAEKLLLLINYLHSNQIIHRDIRIPNVILKEEKEIWLIDLGLAVEKDKTVKGRNTDINRQSNEQADFFALGHFLLFLLYSNYSFPKGLKEKSWEEELDISPPARHILHRLLQIEAPYENCQEIEKDIQNFIWKEEKHNVIF
jgi:serine/threonine protein kinase